MLNKGQPGSGGTVGIRHEEIVKWYDEVVRNYYLKFSNKQ